MLNVKFQTGLKSELFKKEFSGFQTIIQMRRFVQRSENHLGTVSSSPSITACRELNKGKRGMKRTGRVRVEYCCTSFLTQVLTKQLHHNDPVTLKNVLSRGQRKAAWLCLSPGEKKATLLLPYEVLSYCPLPLFSLQPLSPCNV